MEELKKYLTENKIWFNQIDNHYISIDGLRYYLVTTTSEGAIFNEKLVLYAYKQDCDRYVYKFGGNWYWEEQKNYDSPKFNELKYIGIGKYGLPTPNFLGIRGAYEILNGSRMYKDWVKKAKFLGCNALGICEKNTLAGVLKFQLECQKNKIKPIIGATYTVNDKKSDKRYDVKVYAKNADGWHSILLMNKEVNVINNRWIDTNRFSSLCANGDLFVVVDPKSIPYEDLIKSNFYGVSNFYQLDPVEYVSNSRDKEYLDNLKKFVRQSALKPVSITDAFYLEESHSYIKKSLNTISGVHEFEARNQFFKSKEVYISELDELFNPEDNSFYGLVKESMANEQLIVDNCNFTVELGVRHLPKYEMNADEAAKFKTNEDLFWFLIEDGFKRKIKKDHQVYIDRIKTEFGVIEKGDVIDYFLILWDIIKYARANDILVGIGRGSAGGSLISYLLDIIQLNPLDFDLLFERFLNEGRIKKSLPDIDTDFPGAKRPLIKRYMEERYGIDQVCSVGTYTALQVKAAIKDLAGIHGVDFADVNQVTTMMPIMKEFNDLFACSAGDSRIKSFVKKNVDLINDIQLILHQPKAKSIHACAMLILPKEKTMFEWIPVVDIDGQMVSEWEGGELEAAGFLKEDILGVKQLDKFENIINLIKINKGIDINIYDIPLDDKTVYEYFSKGWNGDVFHFGSTGLTGYCKELKPKDINDLIAGISLYRPGAMENNFHNEYIARKEGRNEVEYFTGSEEILKNTFGVFVYQEQIMKLCQVLGGLSLVEADDVRKAMVKKKFEELTKYKERFLPFYVENFNVDKEYADKVWDSIDKASTYLFNKSHATAYSITGYISEWFKVNYPIEYWSTAIQFADEKKVSNYIAEIELSGDIKVMSVDINNSRDGVRVDFLKNTIYWPISSIKQCGEKASEQIIKLRDDDGQYFSLVEFLDRNRFKGSKVTKQIIENLIMSGAFDDIENINSTSDRYTLIKQFRVLNKIKVDAGKDLFEMNRDKLDQNWWWTLQQKRLSSIAFFNYEKILHEANFKGAEIFPIEDLQIESSTSMGTVAIAGYVTEVIERKSKNGKWCRLMLENNYNFFTVNIFSREYAKLSSLNLVDKVKSLVLLTGKISFDSFKDQNVVSMKEDSELIILE